MNNITLLAIDCTDRKKGTLKTLKRCANLMEFKDVVFLTNRKPRNLPDFITYNHIKKIENINQYNEFVFRELGQYVNTAHALLIQDHAYILHPEVWDDNWLQYDYIGAPWMYRNDAYITPYTREHVRVGNGGFSLRSKKLLELPKKFDIPLVEEQGFYNEDGNICVYHRKRFLELGINYAPIEVAVKFSYENLMQENYGVKPFGFHRNKPIKTWRDE